jgi:hypothetical protein
MADPINPPPEEDFAETREHEFQDAHYHDEDAEIVNDEADRPIFKKTTPKKKLRVPPPRPRHYED